MHLFRVFSISVIFVCTLHFAVLTRAQQSASAQSQHPLTNEDVLQMARAQFDDGTIVKMIQAHDTNFDLSVDAMTNLKNVGVSQIVMQAMLSPANDKKMAPAQAPRTIKPPSDNAVQIPETLEAGISYKGPSGWTKLQELNMAGGGLKHVGKMFVPGLTPQMVWTFRGAHAPAQIGEGKPTFYVKQSPYVSGVAGYSERDIAIVRFDEKKDHRELQTTSGGNMFTFKSGYSKERVPDINVSRASENVFLVTPKEDLAPGEYFLTFGSASLNGYDFGIKSR